jgi:hypothetical protein
VKAEVRPVLPANRPRKLAAGTPRGSWFLRDPELRDDLAFTHPDVVGFTTKKLLGSRGLCRPIVARCCRASLRRGIATPGNDEVYRRSFSALSHPLGPVRRARDNTNAISSRREGTRRLVDRGPLAICAYEPGNARGFRRPQRRGCTRRPHPRTRPAEVPRAGNPQALRAVDQSRLLTAVLDKQRSVMGSTGNRGRDERLARIGDIDYVRARRLRFRDGFRAWLHGASQAAVGGFFRGRPPWRHRRR